MNDDAPDRPALRRSTRTTRVARPIDAPYWESLGFGPTHARNLSFFTYFACTGGTSYAPRDGDIFVPFHEQLLPHWRVFAKWIEEDMKDDGEGEPSDNMEISNISMPKQAFDIVTPVVLRMKGLMRINFNNNGFGHDGFVAVAEILGHHKTICEMHLTEQPQISAESAAVLSEAMRDHPCLKSLRFSENGVGRSTEVLKTILDGVKHMTRVDLRNNDIDATSGPIIANFVAENHPSLSILDLEGNGLDDNNVPALVDALKKNTNLKIFDVVNNEITQEGREEMINAVFDTASLNAVVASNHTCQLHVTPEGAPTVAGGMFDFMMRVMTGSGWSNGVAHEETMKQVNEMVEKDHVISYKVIRALCGSKRREPVPVKLSYLNDVPLKCMPGVLELIQVRMHISEPIFALGRRRLASTKIWSGALDRVFHVVKNWQMPALFEYGTSSSKTASSEKAAASTPKRKARGKRKRRGVPGKAAV
ncbi:hypothetical protein ACHAXT_006746 [Thalassiosira profunda]